MAAAAIPAILEGAGTLANAAGAASAIQSIFSKYSPKFKTLGNLLSSKKRKSAMEYFKGLSKPKGIARLVTKDLPYVLGKAEQAITSGKALKALTEGAADISDVLQAVEGVTGKNRYTEGTRQLLASGLQNAGSVNAALGTASRRLRSQM